MELTQENKELAELIAEMLPGFKERFEAAETDEKKNLNLQQD